METLYTLVDAPKKSFCCCISNVFTQVLCTVYFYLLSQIFRQKHESILTVVAGREIQMERLRLSFRGVQFRLVHKITAPTGPIDVNTHSTRSETFSDVQHVYKCMYY